MHSHRHNIDRHTTTRDVTIQQSTIFYYLYLNMDTYDYIYVLTVSASYIFLRKCKQVKKKRLWIRPIYMRRPLLGDFENLCQELKEDATMFFKYTRMDLLTFNKLLDILGPHLQKRNWRALSAEQRLFITLRYINIIFIN